MSCFGLNTRIADLGTALTAVFYLRLMGLTAGTLVYLFLIALILGHRRPRSFERLLFFVMLALFLIYAGGLLEFNTLLQYGTPSDSARLVYQGIEALGLILLLPVLWHTHYAYDRQILRAAESRIGSAITVFFYVLAAVELGFGIHLFLAGNFSLASRLSIPLRFFIESGLAALPIIALIDTAAELHHWCGAKTQTERSLFRALFVASALAGGLLVAERWFSATSLDKSPVFLASAAVAGVVPGAILIYYCLRRNFLEFS